LKADSNESLQRCRGTEKPEQTEIEMVESHCLKIGNKSREEGFQG